MKKYLLITLASIMTTGNMTVMAGIVKQNIGADISFW